MASGNPVVEILEILTPATSAAALTTRLGGSVPAERVIVHAFDEAIIENIDFKCALRGYSSGGLTFTLPWTATSASSGVTRWSVAIRRMTDDVVNISATHTYDFNDVDDTAASAPGELSMPVITFTDGADMNSWADGEIAIVRVRRNASHANDTMTGDAELWGILGKET